MENKADDSFLQSFFFELFNNCRQLGIDGARGINFSFEIICIKVSCFQLSSSKTLVEKQRVRKVALKAFEKGQTCLKIENIVWRLWLKNRII